MVFNSRSQHRFDFIGPYGPQLCEFFLPLWNFDVNDNHFVYCTVRGLWKQRLYKGHGSSSCAWNTKNSHFKAEYWIFYWISVCLKWIANVLIFRFFLKMKVKKKYGKSEALLTFLLPKHWKDGTLYQSGTLTKLIWSWQSLDPVNIQKPLKVQDFLNVT